MPKVLLGLCDEFVEPVTNEVTCFTNFIGGKPCYFKSGIIPVPNCKLCNQLQVLVVQLYCPLEGFAYDRIIQVFACTRKCCWNKSKSWTVYRSQQAVLEIKNMPTNNNTVQDEWGTCDDWGDETDENFILPEAQSNQQVNKMFNTYIAKESNINTIMNSFCELDINNYTTDNFIEELRETESSGQCCKCIPEDDKIGSVTNIISSCLNRVHSSEAENISSDTITFRQHYINVIEESINTGDKDDSHEMALLADYAQRENVSLNELLSGHIANVAGESYEKAIAKHGDSVFTKFLQKISSCREQVIRYSFDGEPVRMTSRELPAPLPCTYCGSAKIFEMQLMPSLLNILNATNAEDSWLEFGSIHIYVCSKSCWNSEDLWREEEVILEPDPDL